MVDPHIMCRQHLLGEHNELHKLAGTIRHGNWARLKGHAAKGQIELASLCVRHEELVHEMIIRGYNHQSPIEQSFHDLGRVDRGASMAELMKRCPKCKSRAGSGLNK